MKNIIFWNHSFVVRFDCFPFEFESSFLSPLLLPMSKFKQQLIVTIVVVVVIMVSWSIESIVEHCCYRRTEWLRLVYNHIHHPRWLADLWCLDVWQLLSIDIVIDNNLSTRAKVPFRMDDVMWFSIFYCVTDWNRNSIALWCTFTTIRTIGRWTTSLTCAMGPLWRRSMKLLAAANNMCAIVNCVRPMDSSVNIVVTNKSSFRGNPG